MVVTRVSVGMFVPVNPWTNPRPKLPMKPRNGCNDVVWMLWAKFAPAKWDGLSSFLAGKKIPPSDLERLGLVGVNERGRYDFFRDRVMLPVIDRQKRVIGFGGRLLDPKYFENGLPAVPDFHGGAENFRSVDFMAIPFPPMQTLATLIFSFTSEALLRENPHPTELEIREALSGNLCRCTGYNNIVLAVQRAAERLAEHPNE